MVYSEFVYSPVVHNRISPKPTFETMAPFTNIKHLVLDARLVYETRIHQIEGMVKKAVETCERLQRVEVRSDNASAQHASEEISEGNEKWVARLNQGMRLRAKLMEVDSNLMSWHWFWQAPELKTLTWTEKAVKK
jgi:hypothetical protein